MLDSGVGLVVAGALVWLSTSSDGRGVRLEFGVGFGGLAAGFFEIFFFLFSLFFGQFICGGLKSPFFIHHFDGKSGPGKKTKTCLV